MNIDEFRKNQIEEIRVENVASGEGLTASFTKQVLEFLQMQEIISDYELCYYEGTTARGKKYRVDAYSYDEADSTLSIFITDFDGDEFIKKLTSSDAKSQFERVSTFVNQVITNKLIRQLDISSIVYGLAEKIEDKYNSVLGYRFHLITDKTMIENLMNVTLESSLNKRVEYNIWDIGRMYNLSQSDESESGVVVSFSEFGIDGLPFLNASQGEDTEIGCYLSVIPGSVLADIFDKYGSRLLEGNVRSFLSTKVAVNKQIRNTILNEKEKLKFFAYNNGISVTVSEIEFDKVNGLELITRVGNMQIVNGGQTTASLSNARFRDKADLSGIFIQVKISHVSNDLSKIIIPKIAKSSNSQNKVSNSDFFSNEPFPIRIEQISRRLYAPAINGNQYETIWFYERTKGQYLQEQSKMKSSEIKKFQMRNPKNQLITKTQFAQYRNIWSQKPYLARKGAERNNASFANEITLAWEKNNSIYNENYYKETVAIAIMYRQLNRKVMEAEWYRQGYAADITTYTLSWLSYISEKNYPGYQFDMQKIWLKQQIPSDFMSELPLMAKFVLNFITDENRPIMNVTEWVKKENCWQNLKLNKFEFSSIKNFMVPSADLVELKADAAKDQKIIDGIQIQTQVINLGGDFWKRAAKFGLENKLISEKEMGILEVACNMSRKLPSESQCRALMEIHKKLVKDGFTN